MAFLLFFYIPKENLMRRLEGLARLARVGLGDGGRGRGGGGCGTLLFRASIERGRAKSRRIGGSRRTSLERQATIGVEPRMSQRIHARTCGLGP